MREKGRAVFLAAIMVLSVVAMGAAFAGSATAEETLNDWPNAEDDRFWHGQTLNITDESITDDQTYTVELVSDDESEFREIEAGDGYLKIETNRLDNTGEWEISGPEADADAGFTLSSQSLTASPAADAVNAGESVNVEFDSERSGYDLELTAENFDGEELDEIIDYADTSYDDDVLTLEGVSSVQNVEFTFSEDDVGTQNLTASAADTVAEDEFSIEVLDADEAQISFEENLVRATPGDYGVVKVDLENTQDAYLNITWDYNGE
ncbi:surface glycoprotein, partial [Halovivax sp.]|uniref:surface glycoprotein n=1 Tax=Halovivax sp. TaxID=1935978 RepID=UPI0025B7CFF4